MSRRPRNHNRNRNLSRMVARVTLPPRQQPPVPPATPWEPDPRNAHLFDAARGLATLCLPLHPPVAPQ